MPENLVIIGRSIEETLKTLAEQDAATRASEGIVVEEIDDEPTRRWASPQKVADILDSMAEAAA